MLAQGFEIEHLFGHWSVAMTRRYAHLIEACLGDDIFKMAEEIIMNEVDQINEEFGKYEDTVIKAVLEFHESVYGYTISGLNDDRSLVKLKKIIEPKKDMI